MITRCSRHRSRWPIPTPPPGSGPAAACRAYRRFLTLLALALVALLTGCHRDRITPPETTAGEPADEETIGQDGGELTTEGFTLAVPPGAFNAAVALKLYKTQEEPPLSVPGGGTVYRIVGLPAAFNAALELRVTTDLQSAPGGEPAIVFGGSAYTTEGAQGTVLAYTPLDTEISGDTLTARLPVPQGGVGARAGTATTGLTEAIVFGTRLWIQTSNRNHFQLIWTSLGVPPFRVDELAGFLEEAYDTTRALGFDFEQSRTGWPMNVSIHAFDEADAGAFGFYTNSRLGDNFGTIEFNESKLDSPAEMRITALHEFVHLAQSLYDPRNAWDQGIYPPPHHWLNEAVGGWSEELFSDDANYNSATRATLEFRPFRGLHPGIDLDVSPGQHGYGCSALIQYLVREYGRGVLVDIYDRIRDESDAITAINEVTGGTISTWWRDFLRDYAAGGLYPLPNSNIMREKSGTFTIDDEEDVFIDFNRHYQDLSGRFFLVEVKDPDLKEEDKLVVTVDSPRADVYIYSFLRQEIDLLVGGGQAVSLSNLKGILEQDRNLWVLVTNGRAAPDYTGLSNIWITMERKAALEFDAIDLELRARVIHRHLDGREIESPLIWTASSENVTREGNSFSGGWTGESPWDEESTHHVEGFFTGTLNDDEDMIVELKYRESSEVRRRGSSTPLIDLDCTLANIPLVGPGGNRGEFRVEGTTVCDHILEANWHDPNGSDPFTFGDRICNAESRIVVDLRSQ